MRKRVCLWVLLACPTLAWSQGVRVDNPGGPAQKIVQNFISPIPGATITVCTSAATGTPCTPLVPTSPVTLCTDSTCSTAAPNPFTADASGNFGFWAVPGTYKVSITAPGTISGPPLTVTLPCAAGISCVSLSGNNTLTGLNNFTGGLQNNGVAVPTLPINLATQVTGTLAGANMAATNLAGGNANGGVAGTLPGPDVAVFGASGASHAVGAVPDPGSSAGTTHFLREDATWATIPPGGSTVLNAQGDAGAITGTGAVATVYTYTLPGNTVPNLKAIRVTVGWSHSTGTANVSYNLTLNGVTSACNPSSSTAGGANCTATILNNGATTGDATSTSTLAGAAPAVALTGLAWSSNQVLKFTFNVANTDAVTPILWLVEIVQ